MMEQIQFPVCLNMTMLSHQSLVLNIFFAIIFSAQAMRTNRIARNGQFNGDRSEYCGPKKFRWKDPGPKLTGDCDILKDKMKILLKEMTEKTECIRFVDLAIDGEPSARWNKFEHLQPHKPEWILMENPLSDRRKRGQRRVTVTARNPNLAEKDKQMSFHVNVEKCANFGVTNANEETTKEPGDEQDGNQNDQENTATIETDPLPIIAAVGGIILLVLAVAVLLVWRKKMRQRHVTETIDTDENHTYGTYSRGWEEDGVYGDGDKVYVTDKNDYYAIE